jgi:serine/threonine protein kinase
VSSELTRGGVGRILKAHDERLDRPVAVKELLSSNAKSRERFRREVAITARLQHPAIVPIYDAGIWRRDEPYYVMKLVSDGRTLKELIADRATLLERLALLPNVIAVADAIAYAHSVGIIHRDIKPSNILVGRFGETVVIDWGVAKDLSTSPPDGAIDAHPDPALASDVTSAGAVVGTPQYMSPEQACGNEVDRRADVYALGAVLYHLVAGEAPFAGSTSREILERVKHELPVPLAQRSKTVPPELATIIQKAMAPNPADRFGDAQELVEDLKRFQTGQLVRAHQYSASTLVHRWLRRNSLPVGIAALFLALLTIVGWTTVPTRCSASVATPVPSTSSPAATAGRCALSSIARSATE